MIDRSLLRQWHEPSGWDDEPDLERATRLTEDGSWKPDPAKPSAARSFDELQKIMKGIKTPGQLERLRSLIEEGRDETPWP